MLDLRLRDSDAASVVLSGHLLSVSTSNQEIAMGRDIDDLPKNDVNFTALTPLWFLERAALVHPTRRSVVHGSQHYTWHQTYQRCRRFASALSNHSIGPDHTVLAISACTTLVSVEPKLTVETRNHVMKATLGFFAIQNDPVDVVNPLIDNLITLLCAILLTGCICVAKS